MLQAKKALIIGLSYLKYLAQYKPDLVLKIKNKSPSHKKLEDKIREDCREAAIIFIKSDCKKLALRANLIAIELFWESEDTKQSDKDKR